MTLPDNPAASGPSIDPKLVLAYIERSGELGAALVREAHWHIAADHLLVENKELREQVAATDDQ